MPPKQKGTKRAAAAAAAASDDDGQSAADKRQKTDSNAAPAAAPAAFVPLSDAPICPVCLDTFACEESKDDSDNRIPRTLPCTHSACSACLLKLITATPGRVKCPTCSDDRPVQLPAGMAPAAVSTPAAWLRCIPQSADIIMAIKRSQQLESALKVPLNELRLAPAARCSADLTCAAAAVKWCEECGGEMCAAHDASTHARHLSNHKRTLLAHKQAEQQAKLQSARATAGAQLKSDVDEAVSRLAQVVSGIAARVRHKDRQAQQVQHELAALRAQESIENKLLFDLRVGSRRIGALTDADAQLHEADMDRLLQAARRPPAAAAVGVGLLNSLTNEEFGQLVSFLLKSGVGMAPPRLLFRATRDGFKRADFVRCCVNKRSTLTLVKVKDNGFIFGAYTHCAWPAANGVVTDPTGKSFLFSLINASGNAVRFSLQDKDRAIRFSDGIGFGAEKWENGKATGNCNFILMHQGQVADQKDANAANNPNLHNTPYQPDDGQMYDNTFLAGQQFFAAEQIEVYQL